MSGAVCGVWRGCWTAQALNHYWVVNWLHLSSASVAGIRDRFNSQTQIVKDHKKRDNHKTAAHIPPRPLLLPFPLIKPKKRPPSISPHNRLHHVDPQTLPLDPDILSARIRSSIAHSHILTGYLNIKTDTINAYENKQNV